jgi:hypothetical protein
MSRQAFREKAEDIGFKKVSPGALSPSFAGFYRIGVRRRLEGWVRRAAEESTVEGVA